MMADMKRSNIFAMSCVILALACLLAGAPQVRATLVEGAPPTGVVLAAGQATASEAASPARLLRLESIDIQGNKRTPVNTIRDCIGLAPGDGVSVEILEQARLRLLATDYFRSVELYTRPGSERGNVVLVVDVVERSFPSFETGFGYDDLHGWFLTIIGMRFDNMFGVESRFRMGLRLGFRISGLDAEWAQPLSHPGAFGLGFGAHVYNQKHLFFGSGPGTPGAWQGNEWRRYEQQIKLAGAEASLRYRLGGATRVSFGLQVESSKPDSTFDDREDDTTFSSTDFPPALATELDKRLTTGFIFRIIHDTRDYVPYPAGGWFALAAVEANNSWLGGDDIYTKANLDIRRYTRLGGETILAARVNTGVISQDAPYYRRFYLGGNYSIRGFEEWSLSPTEGDDGFWLANVEVRTPLVRSSRMEPRLTGLVFFDAGQGWRHGEAVSTADIESAAGYGLRLRLPWLGTLGLDAGIPFSNGRTGDPFRVHGLLGFSF
jgi:outer membrane protein assembly factor BamA